MVNNNLQKKVKKINYIKYEIMKNFTSLPSIAIALYGIVISFLTTLFSINSIVSNWKLEHQNYSVIDPRIIVIGIIVPATMVFIMFSIFKKIYSIGAVDKERLTYQLYKKEFVSSVKLFVLIFDFISKWLLLIIMLLIATNFSLVKIHLLLPWIQVWQGVFKLLVPVIIIIVLLELTTNFMMNFTRDQNTANILMVVGSLPYMATILTFSHLINSHPNLYEWLEENSKWVQLVPIINILSLLLVETKYWYFSFFSLLEIIIVLSLGLWKIYSQRMKQYWTSHSDK